MKKLISLFLLSCFFFSADAASLALDAATQKAKIDNDGLLKFLATRIQYPETARAKHVQGNSILLFKVAKGKLIDLRIHKELGEGCDLEVVNSVLAYPDFNTQDDGSYALQTEFRMDSEMMNVDSNSTPPGYKLLRLVINGYPSISASQANTNFNVKWFKVNKVVNAPTILGTGVNQPHFVVDNVAVEHDDFKAINPKDVESITILKPASAILQYGESGAFGAIVIITKNKPDPTPAKVAENKDSKNN